MSRDIIDYARHNRSCMSIKISLWRKNMHF